MLELNDAQKKAVKEWVAGGAGLSDVQKRLMQEFGLKPTYMDVRLLVLDIGAAVQDRAPAPRSDAAAALVDSAGAAAAPHSPTALPEGDEEPFPAADEPPAGGAGHVTVEVDRLMKPGALVSGTVLFSDGVRAQWSLDQYGRLGLSGTPPAYRPAQNDVQEFQIALQKELARQGY